MRHLTRLLALMLGLLSVGACSGSQVEPEPSEPALATPLTQLDTSALAVQRSPFCDRIDEAALSEALGEMIGINSWSDGDRLGSVGALVQEFGCRWRGESASSSAWVLTPPVTLAQARRVLAEEPAGTCRAVGDAPAYGEPSRTLICDRGRRVRLAGLFGDAWLTCELQGEDVTLDLAGRWCAAVAQAAAS